MKKFLFFILIYPLLFSSAPATEANPVLGNIPDTTIAENQTLILHITATDADGDSLILDCNTPPTNAVFVDSFNGAGSFIFTPSYTQEGIYTDTFIVTDTSSGALADTDIVVITVTNTNRKPVLASIGAKSVNENSVLTFYPAATDADGDSLIMTASALTRATYFDSGTGKGKFIYSPNYFDSGGHNVTFIVADTGALADTEVVTITVANVNQLPVLTAIGAQSDSEGVLLESTFTAIDADTDAITMTISDNFAGLSESAEWTDNGDGTALFHIKANYNESVICTLTIKATDAQAGVDSEVVVLTIIDVPLVVEVSGDTTIMPGDSGLIKVTVAKIDTVIFTTGALPSGVTFIDSLNKSGGVTFPTTYADLGVYSISFIGEDTVGNTDTQVVTVIVEDSTKIMHYNIEDMSNALGLEHIRMKWGLNGQEIVGSSGADTSVGIPVSNYSLFYSSYRVTKTGGDTSHVRIYAQVSIDNTNWITKDSITQAVNDSDWGFKTWSIPHVNYFRTIAIALAGNDTSRVYLEHSFKRE